MKKFGVGVIGWRNLVGFGNDVYAATLAIKHDMTVNQCEKCVVFSLANAFTSVILVANLADDDVASDNAFAAEFLHATSLGV